MAEKANWVVIATFQDMSLAFPDWYHGACFPHFWGHALSGHLVVDVGKVRGSWVAHELPSLSWDVIWSWCLSILKFLDRSFDFSDDGWCRAWDRVHTLVWWVWDVSNSS